MKASRVLHKCINNNTNILPFHVIIDIIFLIAYNYIMLTKNFAYYCITIDTAAINHLF